MPRVVTRLKVGEGADWTVWAPAMQGAGLGVGPYVPTLQDILSTHVYVLCRGPPVHRTQ